MTASGQHVDVRAAVGVVAVVALAARRLTALTRRGVVPGVLAPPDAARSGHGIDGLRAGRARDGIDPIRHGPSGR